MNKIKTCLIKNAEIELKKAGIEFETRNNGVHLMVFNSNRERYDFWPSTYKSMKTGGGQPVIHGGVSDLIKQIKTDNAKNNGIQLEKDIDDMTKEELKDTILILVDRLNKHHEK